MRQVIDGDTARFYGTLEDFARHAMSLTPELETREYASRWVERPARLREHGQYWSGTRTFQEAYDLAIDGWTEGLKRIGDMREALMDRVGEMLPETTYAMDVSGFDVDVGAYLAGEPEHMVTTVTQPGRSRHIHVVVNVGANSRVSPNVMMLRGLLAAGVVDSLEKLGHRVTLDVVLTAKSGKYMDKYGVVTTLNIKRAEDALDLERTVYACAHPSVLRRLQFSALESLSTQWRERLGAYVDQGYGRSGDFIDLLDDDAKAADIYIGTAQQAKTMEEVMDLVLNHLRECGALLE